MPYLSENPRLRLVTLCLLYVSQGIPYGFLHTALKPHLVGKGIGVAEIGSLLVFATLPWSFKFLWGPLIDALGFRGMGKRRPWILFAQGGMVITLALMPLIGEPHLHLGLLAWMLFVHNLFSSLQDVSVDALAVDMLAENERGRANGMMFGSSVAGNSLSGILVGYVIGSMGFASAVFVQVAVLFLIFLIPLNVLERPGEKRLPWSRVTDSGAGLSRSGQSLRELFPNLLRAFFLRSPMVAILLAVCAMIGYDAFATAEDNFFIDELGWSQEKVRNLKSLFLWITVGGCVSGGFLADKIGAKRTIAMSTVVLGSLLVGFGLIPFWWEAPGVAISLMAFGALFIGVLNVSLFSLFMKVSWPVVAASQFTFYMAMLNVSKTAGAGVAGPLKAHFDWPLYFIAVGLIQMGIVIFLPFIDPGETRRKLAPLTPPDPNTGGGSNY